MDGTPSPVRRELRSKRKLMAILRVVDIPRERG
ncbi:hypothetical protein A2U01_0117004, partial [Trifolium medium]|nr:hypothetical protein [Trifolium medium]